MRYVMLYKENVIHRNEWFRLMSEINQEIDRIENISLISCCQKTRQKARFQIKNSIDLIKYTNTLFPLCIWLKCHSGFQSWFEVSLVGWASLRFTDGRFTKRFSPHLLSNQGNECILFMMQIMLGCNDCPDLKSFSFSFSPKASSVPQLETMSKCNH